MAKVVTTTLEVQAAAVTNEMVVGFKNSDGNRFKFIKCPSDDKFIAVSLDNSSTFYASRLTTDTLQGAIAVIQNHYEYEVFASNTLEGLLADLSTVN